MEALTTVYWVTFGFGLVYVLLTGTLGAVSHGIEALGDTSVDADVSHGIDLDVDHDVDFDVDHDASFDAGLADADLDVDHDFDVGSHGDLDAHLDADFAAAQGGGVDERQRSMPKWNPLSPLSIAGFLAAFGGAGLVALGYNLPWLLTLPIAIGCGMVMSILLWLVIGRLMFGMMQSSSEARVIDMIGLEAEVLTPVEHDMAGEIAYILEGTRYTAPARLISAGRIEKRETVRIRKMSGNMVYVEPRRKILS